MPLALNSGNQFAPVIKSAINQMVKNYLNGLNSIASTILQQRFQNPSLKDAKCAWVSKAEIEALLNDNNANGIRLYYGIHDSTNLPNGDPIYNGYHNAILVATTSGTQNPTYLNSADLLSDKGDIVNSVVIPGPYAGDGSDGYPLCPPKCSGIESLPY